MTREDELDRLLEAKGLLPQAVVGAPRIRQVDEGAAPDEDLFEVEVDTPEGTRKAVVPRAAASYLQYRDTESTVADLPSLKPGQVLEQPRPAPAAPKPTRTAPQVALRAPQPASPMRPFTSLAGGAPRPDLDQEGVAIRPMAEQATNGQRVAGEVAGTRLMDGMQAERAMSPEEAAQQQARVRALAVALGRAGAMAGQAISGAQAPMGLYDAMGQEADLPVRELVARRARERQQRLADPTSEESKRLQAAVSKALPGVYAPEELASIAAEDEPLILKTGEMRQRLEERRAEQAARAGERDEDRAFRLQMLQEQRRTGAADRALRREELAAMQADKAQERERVRGEQQMERLAEDYGKAGAPGFYQQQQVAQRIIDESGEDLPGFGPLAGRLPDALTSDKGVQLRQAVGQMLAEYRKGVTGAGMSDSERAEYERITGLLESGTEERVKLGIQALRQAMDTRVQALAAGKRPDVAAEYGRRVPSFGAATAAPQASAGGERKQYSKSRNQTRVLDAQGNVIRTEPGDTRGK